MSEKELLKLRIYPIKSALVQMSVDIRDYLANKKNPAKDCENFEKFQTKYNSLTNNFHQIMDELIPLC